MEYSVTTTHCKTLNEESNAKIPVECTMSGDTSYDYCEKVIEHTEDTEDSAKDLCSTLQAMSENSVGKIIKSRYSAQTYSEQSILPIDFDDKIPNQKKENIKEEIVPLLGTGIKRKFESDFSIDPNMSSNTLSDEKKISNLRKNIRDVMGENQLDTNTIVAQREESERLARVAEQQKIIREYQRQTAVNKLNVRTQNRVLSLLQSGNTRAKIADITDECSPGTGSESSDEVYNSGPSKKRETPNITASVKKPENLEARVSNSNAVVSDSMFPVNDIVTIDDSSSEDDCIILSDEEDCDPEQEVEDDPNNSGLHVKDAYNVPDEQGRVVVNIGHPEGEDDIFVAPQIAKSMKPHQIGGVRFLFDNIIESTKRFNSSTGFGCILAHSMGLGKTLQVVCFCDIFLRHTHSKTILCVMPINTLQNWVSEFDMWIPMKSDDTEQVRPRSFKVFVLNDQQKTLNARSKVILKWAEEGGVLLMGYELFRLLALKLVPNRKRRVGKNFVATDKIETEAHKRLSENIYQAIVKPGPDLVICDEGHRIKNSHAGISLALKQIRTRRRIVLTGYPLQNNLMEYWCMVDFVRPNYLGTRTEFSNMFERPIQNGQCIDSTPEDIKLMRYRAHVLHSLLVGFVQRRSHVVLQHTLPRKLEYVILLKMSDFQRKLYDTFMNDVVRKKAVPNPLKAFAVCCKIWNHPDVLYNFLKKRETDLDLEIDDGEVIADTIPLKDSIHRKESLLPSKEHLKKSEEEIYIHEENKAEFPLISKPQIKDSKGSTQNINTDCRVTENTIGCSSFIGDDFSQSFYPTNQLEKYLPGNNGEPYWNDSNTSYYSYPSLCGNIGPSIRPDYVGMVVQETREKENTNSSHIVDLDTKEIKIVETDIDVTINQMVSNSISSKKEILSFTNIYNQKSGQTAHNTSKTNLKKNSSSSSSNTVSSGSVGSFEKDLIKVRSEDGIPYDWAIDIMKGYEPNQILNSPKMNIFFCILNESIKQGDRILLFSQSLLTLNLIETFLQSTFVVDSSKCWKKNTSYFRLDGSTPSQEREKLVNDFNSNSNIMLFLISTKAGSLGINLVGANRVIVFDASWNPCHDTQAVYRIYRYGQQKPCFVYRIVMDKCLEKKIYDRQVKKQGMSNRVVDECNPDAHLSMKDVTNLCFDYDTDAKSATEFQKPVESYNDIIIQKIVEKHKDLISKEPFHHESLLIDRKEKKLSLAEKRQAQRGYELEKKASSKQIFNCQTNKLQYRIVRNDGTIVTRPVASVRPMQATKAQNAFKSGGIRSTRWIPAEVWQRQGMTAQEMTLPLDVVIPTNSSDKTNIILKSGQRVMVLKSPKGIYMQLESGKIIAIRTSSKLSQACKNHKEAIIDITSENPKATKQTAELPKDKITHKSVNGQHCKNSTLENANNKAAKTGLEVKSEIIVINEDKSSKTVNTSNQQNLQKQQQPLIAQKKIKSLENLNVNKMSGTNKINKTTFRDNLMLTQTDNTVIDLYSEKEFANPQAHNLKVCPTEKAKGDGIQESTSGNLSANREISVESFHENCVNSNTYKESCGSSALAAKYFPDISSKALDKLPHTCNITQEKINPECQPQKESFPLQRSLQTTRTQNIPQMPSTQQHLPDQREPFVPVYNIQHSPYVDKIEQVATSRTTTNTLLTNLESTHYPQYYDPMYDNGVTSSFEYPHRYSNYSTNNSYVNPEAHYHSHYHNFSNVQTNAIGTHPYYMHWPPPPIPAVTQNNNQHNLSSPYPPNGPSVNQWHN